MVVLQDNAVGNRKAHRGTNGSLTACTTSGSGSLDIRDGRCCGEADQAGYRDSTLDEVHGR